MAKFEHNTSATVGQAKVAITGRGVAGEVTEGLPSARGTTRRRDEIDAALEWLEHEHAGGLALRAAFTVSVDSPRRGTRGGGDGGRPDEPPAVVFEVPEAAGERAQIAIVEDDGFRYFTRQQPNGEFEIPVEPTVGPHRGLTQLAGRFAVRVIGVFAKEAIKTGATLAVKTLEGKLREHRLRSFAPADHLSKQAPHLAPGQLEGGPALLFIHGLNSATHNAFRFDRDYVAALHQRYGGRVAAFDHPTLAHSPRENAEWLASHLERTGLERVDVLAHSRGGLVARELIDVLGAESGAIRSVVFVASPNGGTPLADDEHLDDLLSMAANLTSMLPDNPMTDVIGIGLEAIREWVLGAAYEAFAGIACMNPDSEVVNRLSQIDPGDTTYRAIASHYEPRTDQGRLRRAADFVMDKAFRGVANDLLVPTRSTYDKRDMFHVPAEQRFVLDSSFGISHSTFWPERLVLRQLDQWLDPSISIEQAKPVPAELTDPAADFELATRTGDIDLIRTTTRSARAEVLGRAALQVGGVLDAPPTRSRDATKRDQAQGTVVVLPGILGSRLRVAEDGDERGDEVWLNKWALVRGRFPWLRFPDADGRTVRVDGLMSQYAPLLARLSSSWDVHAFAYDWRRSIDELAEHLAGFLAERSIDVGSTGHPVHFVGHSMGGLVARAYIGDHRDAWERGRGRLVQLGTPNWGSFAMVAAALGEEFTVRALAAADVFNSKADIIGTFGSFPSIYQLFPSPERSLAEGGDPAHADLYTNDSWHPTMGDDGASALDQSLIEAAKQFHTKMAAITADDDRFVFVAGDDRDTPYRARIESSGKVSFGITRLGDGRVPHDFGHGDLGFAAERTFFVDSSHGDLANDARVLSAIDELLESGTAGSLASEPRGTKRGAGAGSTDWVSADELERALGLPTPSRDRGAVVDVVASTEALDQAAKLYVGGNEGSRLDTALNVQIVHCSMEQAKYAVAAGRYKGIPMEGAIAFLDQRLGGALLELQEFDLSPEEAGSARYVPPPDAGTFPRGAIVVGLGEFGQLSSTQLTRAIEQGTIEYALARRGAGAAMRSLGVSSVLIGTPGRYGLSVQGSIFATVQGVARAAARLKDHGIAVEHLEFIELYEGKAEQAALALRQLQRANRFGGMEIPVVPQPLIDVRDGGRPGSGAFEESGAPWLRLQLHIGDESTTDQPSGETPTSADDGDAETTAAPARPRSQPLTWISLGRSSQAERMKVHVPTEEIKRHVRAAVHDPRSSVDTNLTLFEMLFPHDAKLELDEQDNLHLLVDETTAWIPWELVTGRDTNGNRLRPLARRAGVLRQLVPMEAERIRRTFRPIGRKALVIGDPPGDPECWPRLPGARNEARLVAEILEDAGFEVTSLIYDGDAVASSEIAAEIRDAFFAEHYRVIHIAGHGTFEEGSDDPFANGIVIGPDEVLCAGHFEDRLVTPDLVFLNCCHIGRIDAPDQRAVARRSAYAELAASTSLQLMKIGVRAVVAAGWAVDDRAAATFAESFYSRMIEGDAFGASVGAAREHADDGRSNTWGAYQCYGDPDFQFYRTERASSDATPIVSRAHLIKHLKALEKKAGDADESSYSESVARWIRDVEDEHCATFAAPEVWEAFAAAYAEAGAFDDAVYCYRQALKGNQASASIGALERLANLESRLASVIHRGDAIPGRRVEDSPSALCKAADKRLRSLIALSKTPERLVLKGSLYKRWATIRNRRADDLRISRDAYADAADLSRNKATGELDVYHGCLAVQMAHLAGLDGEIAPGTESNLARFKEYRKQLEHQLDGLDPAAAEGSYWRRARWIDIVATGIISRGQIADIGKADEIVDGFRKQFAIRSTAKQRQSVIDHYRELGKLLPTPEEQEVANEIAHRLAHD